MGKTKKTSPSSFILPQPPFIFLKDESGFNHTDALAACLPSCTVYTGHCAPSKDVVVIYNSQEDHREAVSTADSYREQCIAQGCNFVSINLHASTLPEAESEWGTNHIDLCVEGMTPQAVGEALYKRLCNVGLGRVRYHGLTE